MRKIDKLHQIAASKEAQASGLVRNKISLITQKSTSKSVDENSKLNDEEGDVETLAPLGASVNKSVIIKQLLNKSTAHMKMRKGTDSTKDGVTDDDNVLYNPASLQRVSLYGSSCLLQNGPETDKGKKLRSLLGRKVKDILIENLGTDVQIEYGIVKKRSVMRFAFASDNEDIHPESSQASESNVHGMLSNVAIGIKKHLPGGGVSRQVVSDTKKLEPHMHGLRYNFQKHDPYHAFKDVVSAKSFFKDLEDLHDATLAKWKKHKFPVKFNARSGKERPDLDGIIKAVALKENSHANIADNIDLVSFLFHNEAVMNSFCMQFYMSPAWQIDTPIKPKGMRWNPTMKKVLTVWDALFKRIYKKWHDDPKLFQKVFAEIGTPLGERNSGWDLYASYADRKSPANSKPLSGKFDQSGIGGRFIDKTRAKVDLIQRYRNIVNKKIMQEGSYEKVIDEMGSRCSDSFLAKYVMAVMHTSRTRMGGKDTFLPIMLSWAIIADQRNDVNGNRRAWMVSFLAHVLAVPLLPFFMEGFKNMPGNRLKPGDQLQSSVKLLKTLPFRVVQDVSAFDINVPPEFFAEWYKIFKKYYPYPDYAEKVLNNIHEYPLIFPDPDNTDRDYNVIGVKGFRTGCPSGSQYTPLFADMIVRSSQIAVMLLNGDSIDKIVDFLLDKNSSHEVFFRNDGDDQSLASKSWDAVCKFSYAMELQFKDLGMECPGIPSNCFNQVLYGQDDNIARIGARYWIMAFEKENPRSTPGVAAAAKCGSADNVYRFRTVDKYGTGFNIPLPSHPDIKDVTAGMISLHDRYTSNAFVVHPTVMKMNKVMSDPNSTHSDFMAVVAEGNKMVLEEIGVDGNGEALTNRAMDYILEVIGQEHSPSGKAFIEYLSATTLQSAFDTAKASEHTVMKVAVEEAGYNVEDWNPANYKVSL